MQGTASTGFEPLVRACVLALLLTLGLGEGALAQGYDPRTWSYDETQDVLMSPSDVERQIMAEPDPDWRPIPREIVSFGENLPVGSILINTSERRLYYVVEWGKALRYAVGVGREGFVWSGTDRISAKKQWPDWHPPAEMLKREAANGRILPARVEGGPENPLGARALYIGSTLYRIHGTNQPWTVGRANSSGCIRMTNEDVIDLYERVGVGSQVIVRH